MLHELIILFYVCTVKIDFGFNTTDWVRTMAYWSKTPKVQQTKSWIRSGRPVPKPLSSSSGSRHKIVYQPALASTSKQLGGSDQDRARTEIELKPKQASSSKIELTDKNRCNPTRKNLDINHGKAGSSWVSHWRLFYYTWSQFPPI